MELQDFRTQVESWPRNQRGRLMLSESKKNLIRNIFSSSGLALVDFCEATGLKPGTVSKIAKGTKKVSHKKKPVKLKLFEPVKLILNQEESSWNVSGPNGLQVKCKNLSQLTQLWRALC